MGQLDKFSIKGLPGFKSGEGQSLLGNASTPLIETFSCGTDENKKLCKKTINPWSFSADNRDAPLIEKINSKMGNYVVIQYAENIVDFKITYDTKYRVKDVIPVDQSITPARCLAPASVSKGLKSDGYRTGRVVKISSKGLVSATKSFEVIFQVGNSGSQFIEMSAESEEMANCLLEWVVSGRKAKLTYTQSYLRNPLARDTSYEILSVESDSAPAATGLTQ